MLINIILNILLVIAAIYVHEFGHYISAIIHKEPITKLNLDIFNPYVIVKQPSKVTKLAGTYTVAIYTLLCLYYHISYFVILLLIGYIILCYKEDIQSKPINE